MSDNSKFQQKKVRRYLKGVRFRMRRRQRFFLYGLAAAVFFGVLFQKLKPELFLVVLTGAGV